MSPENRGGSRREGVHVEVYMCLFTNRAVLTEQSQTISPLAGEKSKLPLLSRAAARQLLK